jgi:hypothetical protein
MVRSGRIKVVFASLEKYGQVGSKWSLLPWRSMVRSGRLKVVFASVEKYGQIR